MAVNQAISQIKNFYGTKFFESLSKKLYITEPRKHLLSYARHIVSLFNAKYPTVQTQVLIKNTSIIESTFYFKRKGKWD